MLFSGDLRKDYEALHFLEKANGRMSNLFTKSLKEGIRNVHREQARWEAEELYKWKPYRGEWDSRYCRIEYEGLPDEGEIEEYIKEEWWHWYNPYDDGRDCTGVWFTSSISVFAIPALNKTVVYHIQEMDV